MMRLLVAIAFVAFATAEKVAYDNYKVYRILPSSEEHLEVLKQLENLEGDAVSKLRVIHTRKIQSKLNEFKNTYSIYLYVKNFNFWKYSFKRSRSDIKFYRKTKSYVLLTSYKICFNQNASELFLRIVKCFFQTN